MLKSLTIQNFAIINSLQLEFEHGLCVITGETGAGKSILIEALGIAIGRRIRPHFLKDGKKLSVSLDFDIGDNPAAAEWLVARDMDNDGDCRLRRTSSPDGRSRAYINDSPVTVMQLKELGGVLTDIVGQNTHQLLMQTPKHLEILDLQCAHAKAIKALNQVWKQWKQSAEKIALLSQKTEEMQSRAELLRYQVKELEEFAPVAGEFEAIDQEHKRLAKIDALMESASEAMQLLDRNDEQDIYNSLAKVTAQLEEFSDVDKNLAAAKKALESALENIQLAGGEINRSMEAANFSDEEFSQLETRLSRYVELARKHQIPADELAALYQRISDELDSITNPEHSLEALEKERAQNADKYREMALAISKQRQKTAATFGKDVTKLLHTLNMPAAEFSIRIAPCQGEFRAGGMDEVEFMIKTNPGNPAAPLAQVSSGGELSRISLALQVAIAKHHPVSTLVFDEVDAGVGGKTAELTGKMLQQLSRNVQVFCITHLAQIASFANCHYLVDKRDSEDQTLVEANQLDDEARNYEIARMLAGSKISQSALKNAQEMLDAATQTA